MTEGDAVPGQGRRTPPEIDLPDLIALRDGSLSPQDEAHLTERIASDPRAADLLADLDDTDTILDAVRERSTMPADVTARLEDALERAARDSAAKRDDAPTPSSQDDGESTGSC
jgi:anti-sigma factor RsiW